MASMEEKMTALSELMQKGILTADEFAKVVSALSGNNTSNEVVSQEKTPLEKQYDWVFANRIVNVFKSPSTCKWPELTPEMIIKGTIKIVGKPYDCTFIETYIDAQNSYGAMLRKRLRLVLDENGKIVRALQETKTNGVTLLGMIANAAIKDDWCDICKI